MTADTHSAGQPSVGQPSVKVHGATRELAQSKRVSEFLISLSHCRNYATAFATAVSDDAV